MKGCEGTVDAAHPYGSIIGLLSPQEQRVLQLLIVGYELLLGQVTFADEHFIVNNVRLIF